VASENVEIVERLYESFREGDNETPFRYFDRDIVWITHDIKIPDIERAYHGHEGVRQFWRVWLGAWEEIQWEQELDELPDGRVRARIRQRNKGKGTGIWVDQPPYEQIWTLTEGKVVRMEARLRE
jgi:ketosteroid isomerase-like protein